MENILLSLLILCFFNVKAQDLNIDSCGIDNSPFLNQNEINYFLAALDSSFEISHKDLSNKKILFLYGNFGAKYLSKEDFFTKFCKRPMGQLMYPNLKILMLTEEEKKALQGYDAFIIVWSKIPISEKNRKKFIANGKLAIE